MWPNNFSYSRPAVNRCEYWWDDQVKFGLTVSTAATSEPVTVSEVKAQARISLDIDDTFIEAKIKSARELCEVYIKRAFVSRTLRLTLERFPSGWFYLPRPPLVSVTSIKYYDENGTQQTLSSANYIVDAYTEPGRITPAYNVSWPSIREQVNSIEVLYVAGYGAASAVPQSIKDAISMTVTNWYENRGESPAAASPDILDDMKLPRAAKALLRANAWGYLP